MYIENNFKRKHVCETTLNGAEIKEVSNQLNLS